MIVSNIINDILSWLSNVQLVNAPEDSSSESNRVTVHALNSPKQSASCILIVVVIGMALILDVVSRKMEDLWTNSALSVRHHVLLVVGRSWILPGGILGLVSAQIWLNIQESPNQTTVDRGVEILGLVNENKGLSSLLVAHWHVEVLNIFVLVKLVVIPLIHGNEGWWNNTI
jgi:hypothetical protein